MAPEPARHEWVVVHDGRDVARADDVAGAIMEAADRGLASPGHHLTGNPADKAWLHSGVYLELRRREAPHG